MEEAVQTEHRTRDAVLELLSNEEVASVSTTETPSHLNAGDEYLDLEHLADGVRQASGVASPVGYVLQKKAVSDLTWQRILSELATPVS